jgi:hypothetical protein
VQAEARAQQLEQQAKAEERLEVDAAQAEVVDALDDQQEAERESAAARAEAQRIRRQADGLSDTADVPRDR